MQNIHLSKRYVLSKIVFVNIEDIFSIYGMLYIFIRFSILLIDIVGSVSIM